MKVLASCLFDIKPLAHYKLMRTVFCYSPYKFLTHTYTLFSTYFLYSITEQEIFKTNISPTFMCETFSTCFQPLRWKKKLYFIQRNLKSHNHRLHSTREKSHFHFITRGQHVCSLQTLRPHSLEWKRCKYTGYIEIHWT